MSLSNVSGLDWKESVLRAVGNAFLLCRRVSITENMTLLSVLVVRALP